MADVTGVFAQSPKAPVSFVMSVRPYGTAPTGQIYMKFDIGNFDENLSGKSTFRGSRSHMSGTLHEDLNAFRCWRHKFATKVLLCDT
jgi:hypothetical protein